MKYHVVISNLESVNELPEFWSEADLRKLLGEMGVDDNASIAAGELREYLALAASDLEPEESAAIVLRQLISEDELSDTQVDQVSRDMLLDKIVEEYPEISLHARLFHANQLLYKAYNGKFPNTKASIIDVTITPTKGDGETLDAAAVLQVLSAGLVEHAVLPRLLTDQLAGTEEFVSAPHILWEIDKKGDHQYRLVTSEYWLSEEDFGSYDFQGTVTPFEEEED